MARQLKSASIHEKKKKLKDDFAICLKQRSFDDMA